MINAFLFRRWEQFKCLDDAGFSDLFEALQLSKTGDSLVREKECFGLLLFSMVNTLPRQDQKDFVRSICDRFTASHLFHLLGFAPVSKAKLRNRLELSERDSPEFPLAYRLFYLLPVVETLNWWTCQLEMFCESFAMLESLCFCQELWQELAFRNPKDGIILERYIKGSRCNLSTAFFNAWNLFCDPGTRNQVSLHLVLFIIRGLVTLLSEQNVSSSTSMDQLCCEELLYALSEDFSSSSSSIPHKASAVDRCPFYATASQKMLYEIIKLSFRSLSLFKHSKAVEFVDLLEHSYSDRNFRGSIRDAAPVSFTSEYAMVLEPFNLKSIKHVLIPSFVELLSLAILALKNNSVDQQCSCSLITGIAESVSSRSFHLTENCQEAKTSACTHLITLMFSMFQLDYEEGLSTPSILAYVRILKAIPSPSCDLSDMSLFYLELCKFFDTYAFSSSHLVKELVIVGLSCFDGELRLQFLQYCCQRFGLQQRLQDPKTTSEEEEQGTNCVQDKPGVLNSVLEGFQACVHNVLKQSAFRSSLRNLSAFGTKLELENELLSGIEDLNRSAKATTWCVHLVKRLLESYSSSERQRGECYDVSSIIFSIVRSLLRFGCDLLSHFQKCLKFMRTLDKRAFPAGCDITSFSDFIECLEAVRNQVRNLIEQDPGFVSEHSSFIQQLKLYEGAVCDASNSASFKFQFRTTFMKKLCRDLKRVSEEIAETRTEFDSIVPPRKSKVSRKRVRSRNSYIDSLLRENPRERDPYLDLEDWIVPDDEEAV
jgi:hypothetical protein